MSGWDTPSRPTWDPQDGPEDSTQAFPAPDNSGADDPWSQPAGSGWGGPGLTDDHDFGRADFGAPAFGGMNPAGDDLGGADYRAAGFPPEHDGFPPAQNGFPMHEFEQRKPGATLAGRELPGRGGYGSGSQISARDEPPWPAPSRQESARPEYGRTGEYGRQDLGRADLDRPGAAGPAGPAGQDFPRRDPGRADYTASYSTYSGQPDPAEQAPPAANLGDAELAARMDPALQDFFAPANQDPRNGAARPAVTGDQPRALPGPGLPGPGQGRNGHGLPDRAGPDQSGPGWSDQGQPPPRGSNGRGPQRPARPADPWADRDGYSSPPPQDSPRRPVSHGGRRAEATPEILPSGRRNRIIAIAVVVAIVVAGGAYLALHKSPPAPTADGTPPAGSASTSAPASPTASATGTSKPNSSTKKSGVSGSGTSAGGYLLSTPSTAAGYPLGTDPHFLATATTTVAAIEQSAIGGGGGKVTGSPVSASYTLPDAQTIEFVGYQGTFNPSTVMANLKSYGSSELAYSPGKNGGKLACANTIATSTTPSGAVCVWVTKSTLGFTEFFTQASGPEPLNTAQSKGAQDTVSLRSSVETLKSS